MRKRDAARRLLSAHLAAAFLFLLPIPVRAQTAYRLIGGEEELTTGEYVLVTPEGVAPGALVQGDIVESSTYDLTALA